MFGFLKSKQAKVADAVAESFFPAFHAMKMLNGGVVPEKAAKDDFIIAYMFGAYNFATKMAGVEGDIRLYTGLMVFFQNFFPNNFSELPKYCAQKYSSDESFRETTRLGGAEFQKAMAGMGTMEALVGHVTKNYGKA